MCIFQHQMASSSRSHRALKVCLPNLTCAVYTITHLYDLYLPTPDGVVHRSHRAFKVCLPNLTCTVYTITHLYDLYLPTPDGVVHRSHRAFKVCLPNLTCTVYTITHLYDLYLPTPDGVVQQKPQSLQGVCSHRQTAQCWVRHGQRVQRFLPKLQAVPHSEHCQIRQEQSYRKYMVLLLM